MRAPPLLRAGLPTIALSGTVQHASLIIAIPDHAIPTATMPFRQRCSLFVHYHQWPSGASGTAKNAGRFRRLMILPMRGQAAAEIRHLGGEAKSKTHPLLRRGHSFLRVGEVT
jgi:hypothetical protein